MATNEAEKATTLDGVNDSPQICATCIKWHPSEDHDTGYCNLRPMRSMQPVTRWCDGCDHWESNTPEAK